jgi:hypothetical protein
VKKRLSYSARVLGRIRERRQRRVHLFLRLGLLCLICGFSGWNVWTAHQRLRMNLAPTWAEFRVASPLKEMVLEDCAHGLPCNLIINGEQWSLVKVDHFADAEGHKGGERFGGVTAQTYCDNKTIAYIDTQSMALFRDELMHEVFHAGACLHGGDEYWNSEDPTWKEHPGVYHLGEFMGTFLHDNPQFAVWMTK